MRMHTSSSLPFVALAFSLAMAVAAPATPAHAQTLADRGVAAGGAAAPAADVATDPDGRTLAPLKGARAAPQDARVVARFRIAAATPSWVPHRIVVLEHAGQLYATMQRRGGASMQPIAVTTEGEDLVLVDDSGRTPRTLVLHGANGDACDAHVTASWSNDGRRLERRDS